MFNFFQNIHIDWLGKRKAFIAFSVFIMLAGLASTIGRQYTPGGTDAFNLGVDFKGGTVVVAKFRQRPSDDDIRNALHNSGVGDPVIQSSTDKTDEVLIKIPLVEGAALPDGTPSDATSKGAVAEQVQAGRQTVKKALETFGSEAEGDATLDTAPDAAFKIVGTDSVGAVAGSKLRNQAVTATLFGLIGILLFIAFRYDWTYAAGAVIAVFHDVLMVLAFFSVFQWEINLTVIAAILTIVGDPGGCERLYWRTRPRDPVHVVLLPRFRRERGHRPHAEHDPDCSRTDPFWFNADSAGYRGADPRYRYGRGFQRADLRAHSRGTAAGVQRT